jgi:ABC-2 type transport system permease protein
VNLTLRQTFIIARRDFLAVVATPTFLLFLLAPLFMIILGGLGGTGASQVAQSSANASRIAIIATPEDEADLRAAEKRLRPLLDRFGGPPELQYVPIHADPKTTAYGLLKSNKADYIAVMYGPLEQPEIVHHPRATGSSAFLAELAEQTLRTRKGGLFGDMTLSKATVTATQTSVSSVGGRQTTGYLAVFTIFLVTLLLAGQSVGMLAEEKSNKVIEILAAAAPLEAVFLGKLIGMFGVALLFVGFWGGLAAIAVTAIPELLAAASLQPAIGMATFLILCGLYFTMAYMLLGAVFLGVGGQAGTIREIQMLSLPITVFQVAMFGLSSAAAGSPGSSIARFAEVFPFSSPFAMAARAATDASLWPHLLALLWQGLWVAITILIAARLFRVGVLKSGSWKSAFGFGRSKLA